MFKKASKIYTLNFSSILKIAVCLFLLFVQSNSITAAIKTWTGAQSTNWNVAANWDPVGIPSADDEVIIPGGLSNNPILNGYTNSLSSVKIEANAVLDLVFGRLDSKKIIVEGTLNIGIQIYTTNMVISGTVNQNGGSIEYNVDITLELNGGTYNQKSGRLRIANFISTSEYSVFNSTGGTTTFSGGGSNNKSDFSNGDIQFHNIKIDEYSYPNFDKKGNQVTIKVSGNFESKNSSLDTKKATFIFNGNSEQSIITAANLGTSTFGRLVIDNPTGPVHIDSDVEVENTFTDNSGVFSENGNTLIVNGEVLPVELVSFEAYVKAQNVILSWETATEINNYGFEIERKFAVEGVEDAEWKKLDFVKGNGNSNSPKLYEYIDESDNLSGTYKYRLKQIDVDGIFEYLPEVEVFINSHENYLLDQNHPNPFNPVTNISFSLPEDSNVRLTIYDVLGKEVITLVNDNLRAGSHSFNFNSEINGRMLSSGIYYYQLQTDKFVETKKMNLMK